MNRRILTATATLIAALSVAVMIGAAPANASVGSMSASLSIVPDGGGGHYVTVHAVIRTLSDYEAGNLYKSGCRAVFRLWGDDSFSDDLLLDTSYMNGDGTATRPFEGFFWAPAGRLNEDWGGDEVYAGVRLIGCSTNRSAQSNTVYGNF